MDNTARNKVKVRADGSTYWCYARPLSFFDGLLRITPTLSAPNMRTGRRNWVNIALLDARNMRVGLPASHPIASWLPATNEVAILPYDETDPRRPAFTVEAAEALWVRMHMDNSNLTRVLFIIARAGDVIKWADLAARTMAPVSLIFAVGEKLSFKMYAAGPYYD